MGRTFVDARIFVEVHDPLVPIDTAEKVLETLQYATNEYINGLVVTDFKIKGFGIEGRNGTWLP